MPRTLKLIRQHGFELRCEYDKDFEITDYFIGSIKVKQDDLICELADIFETPSLEGEIRDHEYDLMIEQEDMTNAA